VGSGAYVKRLPGKEDIPGFNISAFELTEARLLFEGEAAALAATTITEEGLAELAALVEEIERENRNPHGTEKADRAFHLAIARATRNAAVAEAVERLWNLRADSPKARCCTKRPAAPTSSRWSRNTPPFSKPCAPATRPPPAPPCAPTWPASSTASSSPPRKRPSPKHAAHPRPAGIGIRKRRVKRASLLPR
jgi:hypothetical protein